MLKIYLELVVSCMRSISANPLVLVTLHIRVEKVGALVMNSTACSLSCCALRTAISDETTHIFKSLLVLIWKNLGLFHRSWQFLSILALWRLHQLNYSESFVLSRSCFTSICLRKALVCILWQWKSRTSTLFDDTLIGAFSPTLIWYTSTFTFISSLSSTCIRICRSSAVLALTEIIRQLIEVYIWTFYKGAQALLDRVAKWLFRGWCVAFSEILQTLCTILVIIQVDW